MRKIIISFLLCTSLSAQCYEPYRGASNSYKNMSSSMVAAIVYQKVSITTSVFSEDAVEPLLKTLFDSSDEFYDHFDRGDFVKALSFYKAVGKNIQPPQLVSDELIRYMVKRYINENCGI